jgi:sugar phosphate isomerase/epimerase
MPLEIALQTIRDLHFTKADLAIHADGPHLTPIEVAQDVQRICARLKATNVGFAAFHLDFGTASADDIRTQLKACCRLARLLTVPVLTVAAKDDVPNTTARLAEWSKYAAADGLMLCVETHADAATASPENAAELCERTPGIGLTLDPSYFLNQGVPVADWDPVWPHVRHVRLRDTGKGQGKYQVRVGQGELEYGRLIAQLERHQYDRALTVDVRDFTESSFPSEPEVRKLKYLLESLV